MKKAKGGSEQVTVYSASTSPITCDPDYDFIPPLPKTVACKRGSQCGECGMKFEYGTAYGFCCQNPRCPMRFASWR